MYIKTLNINNYKCFDSSFTPIKFNIPDQKTLGSGLNILVGENNTGKSTIFEAVDLLRNNTKKSVKDIKNKACNGEITIEIEFSGNVESVIDVYCQQNKKDLFKSYIYQDIDGNQTLKIMRCSSKFDELNLWNDKDKLYKNESGIDAPLKKLFEIDFVWSDTNPNDETSFGATTVCGVLLKEIVDTFEETDEYRDFSNNFHQTFNSSTSSLKTSLKRIEDRTQEIFKQQFSNAKISFKFDPPDIKSFFKGTKIEIDDGVATNMEEKGSGMQRSVALALIQVYAEELVKNPKSEERAKPFFLFIDEPEICLHPKAQLKLSEALLELSKTKQIFIATHSPYFFRMCGKHNVGMFLFIKDELTGITKITNVKNDKWGLLPWSPSWGEVNYFAYKLPTIEFHDELYGYLQYKSGNFKEEEIETYFESKGLGKVKSWTPERGGNVLTPKTVTLPTFIRNKTHHPENMSMKSSSYNDSDLYTSISEMLNIL